MVPYARPDRSEASNLGVVWRLIEDNAIVSSPSSFKYFSTQFEELEGLSI